MKRSILGAAGIAALLATAIVWPFDSPATRGASLAFEATFNTSADFYDRFDYGYSGFSPLESSGAILQFHGDHNMACEAPTTLRDVAFGGSPGALDFSQLFWHCAPGGDPAKGHLMTGVDTFGYNIAWFSPKPFFSNVSGVCWDINLTQMSARKWTQVMFVGQADAVRYPAGIVTTSPGGNGQARGTGGFDLGYTAPDFRQNDPNTAIFPQGGTLAGFRSLIGSAEWFQNQDTFTTRHQGPDNIIRAGADHATRFTHCLSNEPGNIVRLTMETPAGTTLIRDMVGQIPPHPVRVVFQDDNYNPSKGDSYSPDALTWHWDNIQVFTGDGPVPTTTVATPTTVATSAPTTVATTAPTTAAPTTTVATSAPTTVATTPTTAAPTTVATSAPTTVATTAPTTAAPTTVATSAPTTVATTAPTTAAPTTAAPTTAAPTTAAPTTAAPTTAAPTTAAPTTAAPTTATPTTPAPTTAAPTTAAPTTLAPTTAAPTTAAPTTAAPTTPAPTTAAPTTAAAGTTAPAGAAPQQQQAAAPPPNQPPAPNVTFTGGPPETTTERDAVITWDVSDFQATQEFAGLDDFTFTCSLDGADGRVCTSPARYLALELGAHEVVVKAADRTNGAVGTARFRWTIVEGTDRSLTNRSAPLGAVDVGRVAAPSNVRSIPTPYAVPQAVPPSNQNADNATPSTGARSIEIALVGLTMIAIGLVMAGAASVLRRRSA